MCTATYLPFGPTGFILTHSRDEKAVRPAARPPQPTRINGEDIMFPQDPQGRGTWIAFGQRSESTGLTACLLNGAFVAHQPQPPYRYSRGLVVLATFTYDSIDSFISHYSFTDLEPFTLLLAETNRLVELRWNGEQLFTHEKDPQQPHIWSSVTLYTPEVMEKRKGWFRNWLREHPVPSVKTIRWFHQTAGDGDPENSLRMNRRGVFGHEALLTLSLTSVVQNETGIEMVYEDFTQQTSYRQPFDQYAYATI